MGATNWQLADTFFFACRVARQGFWGSYWPRVDLRLRQMRSCLPNPQTGWAPQSQRYRACPECPYAGYATGTTHVGIWAIMRVHLVRATQCPAPSDAARPGPVRHCPAHPYPILPGPVWRCPDLPCLALTLPALSGHARRCPTLLCLALPGPALSSTVRPCPVHPCPFCPALSAPARVESGNIGGSGATLHLTKHLPRIHRI